MNIKTFSTTLVILFIALGFSLAFAAGDAANGKALYNDPTFAGSTNSKSCNSCHPGGSGVMGAGTKEYSSLMGQRAGSLEDVVNICITRALSGKAIAKDSQQMKDMVAYIKSLGK
jgi:cytochrome c